mgnify:CR=1 FL=1
MELRTNNNVKDYVEIQDCTEKRGVGEKMLKNGS